MRLVLVFATALIALAFSGSSSAQAASPCVDPPAAYVAAFDGKDGAVDGKVSYPEPRIYRENQGWVGRNEVPQESEHLHTGMCFPLGTTWATGIQRWDAAHTFFNLKDYKVTDIRGGFTGAGNNTFGPTAKTAANFAALNQAAVASGDGHPRTVYQSYSTDSAKATCSGRVEARIGIKVVRSGPRALVNEWFTSSGDQSYLPGTKSQCSSGRSGDVFLVRNWVAGLDYGNSALGPAPVRAATWGLPRTQPFTLTVGAASGVNRGALHIDPDFHHGFPGVFVRTFTGTSGGSFQVSGLQPGPHKAVGLGRETRGDGIVSTAVAVLPVRVGG